MDKIDFKKTMKNLYRATNKVERVQPGEGTFLVVDGQGAPGGEAFQKAVQDLYPVAYTVKFSLKKAGTIDFVVPPLEALWYDDPAEVPDVSRWRWRTMIRVPELVKSEQLQEAQRTILKKKGTDATDVRLVRWEECESLQVLHIGPYDQVGPVYEQLHRRALVENIALPSPGHEIYLSDPRRATPDKLRTIVRMSIVGESL
jgi:hypothetical protein